jgi:transcriptional regulator with XRE-family HTH domain
MTKQKLPGVAEYLTAMINVSGVKQADLAKAVGYGPVNMITMIKQGKSKVALDKVIPLAKALGVDPAYFLRIWFNQEQPKAWEEIEKVLGLALTANEIEIIDLIRETSDNSNPRMTDTQMDAIRKAFKA